MLCVEFGSRDEVDILEALVMLNRQRERTSEQIAREAVVLMEVERERNVFCKFIKVFYIFHHGFVMAFRWRHYGFLCPPMVPHCPEPTRPTRRQQ